ncbi:MAG: pilus assembly protein PilM, partial [Fimbriimonadaceae bacterium]|nr:pilus assembly protein PilM [Fimbriimonadaceae bacterium]
ESTVESDFAAYPQTNANAQTMDVVMAITPQSVAGSMVAMVKQTGKKAAALDVEPLSIGRALKVGKDAYAGQTVCVVEIGHKTTAINIYTDGRLVMPRQVPIGGEMFTQSIASGLGISMEEAEQRKIQEASVPDLSVAPAPQAEAPTAAYNPFAETPAYNPFAADDGAAPPVPAVSPAGPEAELYNSFAPVLDELAAELRRSLDFYRSKGGDVNAVLLAGGGAKLRGLDRFLSAYAGVPVSIFDPMDGVQVNARRTDAGVLSDHRPDFAVAVGNGLRILF